MGTYCVAKEVKPHPKLAGLGGRIKLLRKSHGMTQQKLAEKAEVSQAAIAGYERNGVPSGFPLSIAMHLAEALNAPLSLLVYGDEEEQGRLAPAQSDEQVAKVKGRVKKSAARTRR